MTQSAPQEPSAAREAVGMLGVTLVCCLFFWKAVTLQGVFFHYDHAIQNYPYRLFFAQGLSHGHLPLWTNDIFCGFPLFAESQGNALYPPFLILFVLLKPWVAYNYYTVLHFLMAGLFTYILARVMHVGRAGASLAGICYMLASPVLSHAHHTNILVGVAWLPLLLALMELVFRRRTLLPLLGFSAAVAALILGAQPQYTLYDGLVCCAYALWRWRLIQLMGARLRTLIAVPAALGVAAALAVALSAVQLLPLLELVGRTTRATSAMALPGVSPSVPGNLMTFLLPHYFGSPGLGSYWGDVDGGLYAELTLFVGAVPLILALVGALTDRSRKTLFFIALALFAFLFSLGFSASFYSIFALLPVFCSARFPSRFAFVTALGVAVLAGVGLERVLSTVGRERTRRAALISSAVVLLLAAATITVAGAFNIDFMSLSRDQLGAAMPLAPFELGSVWNHLHRTLPDDVWRLVAAAAGATLLLLVCERAVARRWRWVGYAGTALWCALAFGELACAGREFTVVTSPAIYEDPPPLAKALQGLPQGRIYRYRYYDRASLPLRLGLYPFTPGWALDPALYVHSVAALPHNANMLWGIPSVNGFSPLQTRALKTLLGQPLSESPLIEFNLSRPLDLLGARYVLTPRAELPGDFVFIRKVGDVNIFENPNALPRTFIVHRGEAVSSEEGAIGALKSEDFDYGEKVLVHGRSGAPASDAPGSPAPEPPPRLLSLKPGRQDPEESAKVVSDQDNVIAVQAHLLTPGYLVLADQDYPGWTVEVDGQKAELLRLDYLLKGVELDAGEHVVTFAFRPDSFRRGMVLSLVALGLLILGSAFAIVRRARLPAVRGPERKRPLDGPYSSGMARLLVLAWLVFLALGPVLAPVHWEVVGAQLDPRKYVISNAISDAYYRLADKHIEEGYAEVRDACRWWPGDYVGRAHLAKIAGTTVARLLDEGRREDAVAIAAEVVALAPREVEKEAPALLALAKRQRAGAGSPAGSPDGRRDGTPSY